MCVNSEKIPHNAKGALLMASRPESVNTPSAREEALATVCQLTEALAAHGIVLPSLDVETASYARFTGRPLIELGRCNNETALALVAVLNGARGTAR
jgi:hypothetical protein